MKAAFVINARNKAKWVGNAVHGALSQTYPCHIILSDQFSTDGTIEAMTNAAMSSQGVVGNKEHKIEVVPCPIEGKYGMRACNEHFMWAASQTDAEWIFQCSADDYSLPDRVRVCMEAVKANDCSVVANTMFFVQPGEEHTEASPRSGFPPHSGYVGPGEGLWKMAYGSTIAGFHRDFLSKVGSAGDSTMDVYYGFLAACDKGFYVVANPQHVHVMHAELDNMGFQGKMRAAEESGDHTTIMRLNELNRFQLLDLYFSTLAKASQLYPMIHVNDKNAILQMVLDQANGWLLERKKLHAEGITPAVL